MTAKGVTYKYSVMCGPACTPSKELHCNSPSAPITRGLHSLTSELNLRTFGNALLTLELNLSTFGRYPRVGSGCLGEKVCLS
jgi:hypothetical protein